MALDPITLEILTEGLISVVREMRATVFRTARSVAIYEGKDYSCALFDAAGQVVAQSEDNGAHVVPMPWTVSAALADFEENLAPDDLILVNDPYVGGTHLNDVTLIYPIFHDGELAFIAAVREHWADVGGAVPGSMSGTATDVLQEGVRIPPVKVIDGGVPVSAVMKLIYANMRVPYEREGDFSAGVTACKTAERRVRELVRRYGLQALQLCVVQNLDRAETRVRAQISNLPDGEYLFEDYLETFVDGVLEPLRLPLRLHITGDQFVADFTGAAKQVPAPANSTSAVTAAGVIIAFKSIFDARAPLNQGAFRPIKIITPPGSIVNVQYPAPTGSHGEIRKRVISVMTGALAQAAPDKVAGDTHRTSFHNLIGGLHQSTGEQFVHYEWSSGGNGAFKGGDGPDAMAGIDWGNIPTIQSTEVIESRYPVLIESSGLLQNGGGDGTWRGGLPLTRSIRILSDEATYSLLSDGAIVPAFGVRNARSASPVGAHIERKGKRIDFATPGKVGGYKLLEDDLLVMHSAGGGGYGDPLERRPDLVLADLREGVIDMDVTSSIYGVIVKSDLSLDEEGTRKRRDDIRAARASFATIASDEELYACGKYSKRRICPISREDLRALGKENGELVEIVGPPGLPLRAWLVESETPAVGSVQIDEYASRVLGIHEGDPVTIRPLR